MNKHTRVGEELLGKRLVGRVVMYSNKNGFGYIRKENKTRVWTNKIGGVKC